MTNTLQFEILDAVREDFAELESLFDSLGENASGFSVVADWREAPVAVLSLAALIAEHVRPEKTAAIPAIAFGSDPTDTVRRMCADTKGGASSNWKVVKLQSPDDALCYALVAANTDLRGVLCELHPGER
jgi:hypothetical protein